MHVMRGRPEAAERLGAGHAGAVRLMGDLGLPRFHTRQVAQDDPLGALRTSARPTSSKGISALSGRTSCGPADIPPLRGRYPLLRAHFLGVGLCGFRD